MRKHRSICFMMWPIILGLVGVAVTVSAIPDMTPEQLEKALAEARQQERESKTLADALFVEAHYRARVGAKP